MNNIEIGIDLGTTNSEIAILNNGNIEIIKNALGDEYTPSVFGINKAKDEEVGKKPYVRYFKDCTNQEIENNKPEIKRLMGTSQKVLFSRVDKEYSPEEISAKILNALKQDAVRKNSTINTTGVVITIPAHFSTVQAEATKRAGEIAGFKYVVLLQEPIAAAISYGFGNRQNENWLVYDLGGGTFDSALISSKDGNLKVLSHSGDNFLGGKDIDNLIVEKIILPKLNEKYNLNSFNRGNAEYSVAFAKLKYSAEQAKIQLSTLSEVNIEIDINVSDRDIYENILITQTDLKNIMDEILSKTIDLCKQTISEAGIKTESINKIILVGGPTQLPFIKTELESKLKIEVDTSSDPLTAIAKGACIFATSQVIPKEFDEEKVFDENTYQIKLNYDSLTSEEDELVTGIIEQLKETEKDYFIQIQSQDNKYNSGRIKLKNGKFAIDVSVETRKTNCFWLYLFDSDGNSLNLDNDSFNITHGLTITGSPIPHSIGVGITNKDMASGTLTQTFDIFFNKNEVLPLEKTHTYKTLKPLTKGDKTNCLPIVIYEGESEIPDRNFCVCEIELTGENIPFDLAQGEDVDITIKINESRELSVEAYLPLIDLSFNARATIYDEAVNTDKLNEELKNETERVKEIDNLCSYEERERIFSSIQDIKESIQNSENDADEKSKTNIKIKKLKSDIDKLKQNKKADFLKQECEQLVFEIADVINATKDQVKKEEYNKRLNSLKEESKKAIEANDKIMLKRTNEQLDGLLRNIVCSDDFTWLIWLKDLETKTNYTDMSQAQYYITRAKDAIQNRDMNEVRTCVSNLFGLLPEAERLDAESKMAGITR